MSQQAEGPRLLDGIARPEDLRRLARERMTDVARELRAEIVDKVSRTGGHLASSLGAVELLVGLHAGEKRWLRVVGRRAAPALHDFASFDFGGRQRLEARLRNLHAARWGAAVHGCRPGVRFGRGGRG